ncbi:MULTISPECIES: LytR/AlgR family response regulator transcription factor [unclassified Tenacibaculum]|uniref:LytR/AlgR family response regulator transcription factor n=1 Tax=unclassified Tenacibaculum TaxID=2635139 RepID=UPI001F23DA46|nr:MULTISPECIES: LytTR family DNA-binding domain-containing protein [unclassified Tenacibaculum]MCF2873166.1 LytTR family DNA-binding domain-containing protein [Tenacibaculum sp. Cn5-1]MCF2933322.1 LytTR family DNA-binding domain-containing protein [Tenacibaculum sp. Cn5-34]MCG7510097.1 LytTR family DNA-binding domain-containing protein [Tenacibaculum sp. Cn5-46]
MYKCIIIDDEEPARDLLEKYCAKIDDLEVVGSFKSPLKCISIIENEDIDILLLDINMPDISGIDFLKSLKKQPKVIFTTAYREYALDGFELDASDYLLKPIEFYRFLRAINKVKQTFLKSNINSSKELTGSIQLKSSKKIYKVNFEDIIYIQSHHEYVMYHTKSVGKLMVYGTMKSVENILPNSHFYRIHRSYIVNSIYIKFIEGNSIVLDDNRLPLGESYKVDFIEKW